MKYAWKGMLPRARLISPGLGHRPPPASPVCAANEERSLSRFLESTRVEIEAEDLIGEQTPEKIAPGE